MEYLRDADTARSGGPTKKNAPATDRGEQTQHSDSRATADPGKAFATLRAELALHSYSLSRSSADDGPVIFYASRWNLSRELPTLAAVATFLTQIGGAA